MSAEEIVEQIMTMHWDMAACPCWICAQGRDAGLHPRECYLDWRGKLSYITVEPLTAAKAGEGRT